MYSTYIVKKMLLNIFPLICSQVLLLIVVLQKRYTRVLFLCCCAEDVTTAVADDAFQNYGRAVVWCLCGSLWIKYIVYFSPQENRIFWSSRSSIL